MPAAAEAIPPNPKSAATSAITRKTTAQYNIGSPLRGGATAPRVGGPTIEASLAKSWDTEQVKSHVASGLHSKAAANGGRCSPPCLTSA
jgi:hypothetical protein